MREGGGASSHPTDLCLAAMDSDSLSLTGTLPVSTSGFHFLSPHSYRSECVTSSLRWQFLPPHESVSALDTR